MNKRVCIIFKLDTYVFCIKKKKHEDELEFKLIKEEQALEMFFLEIF